MAEIECVTNDSSFKRWAVVHVGGHNRQSFRAWYQSREAAEDRAKEIFGLQEGALWFILEVVGMIGDPVELPRKFEDIVHNDIENVLKRLELAKSIDGTGKSYKVVKKRLKRQAEEALF